MNDALNGNTPSRPRTEDDLRAAFELAAAQAPDAVRVLAGVRRREAGTRSRRTFRTVVPIAAAAAVAAAVAIPILAVNGHNSTQKNAASSNGVAAGSSVRNAATAGASAAPLPQLSMPLNSDKASAGSAGGAAGSTGTTGGTGCAASQVTAALTWTPSGTGLVGSLTITDHAGTACVVDKYPSITAQTGAGLPPGQVEGNGSASSNQATTQLRTTLHALVTWTNWCGAPGFETVTVGLGGGLNVQATVAPFSYPVPTCPANHPAPRLDVTGLN